MECPDRPRSGKCRRRLSGIGRENTPSKLKVSIRKEAKKIRRERLSSHSGCRPACHAAARPGTAAARRARTGAPAPEIRSGKPFAAAPRWPGGLAPGPDRGPFVECVAVLPGGGAAVDPGSRAGRARQRAASGHMVIALHPGFGQRGRRHPVCKHHFRRPAHEIAPHRPRRRRRRDCRVPPPQPKDPLFPSPALSAGTRQPPSPPGPMRRAPVVTASASAAPLPGGGALR